MKAIDTANALGIPKALPRLKAAGVTDVILYAGIGGSVIPEKRATKPVVDAIKAAGLGITLCAEKDAGWMLGGRPAGIAAAKACIADSAKFGGPALPFVWAAHDTDITSSKDIAAVVECVRGLREVLGMGKVGIYGSGTVCRTVRVAFPDVRMWLAQSVKWSGWMPAADAKAKGFSLWQEMGQPLGDMGVDYDSNLMFGDGYIGQWNTAVTPPLDPPPMTGGTVGVFGYHTHVKLKEALFVWNSTAGTKRNGGKKWAEGGIAKVTGPIKVINGKKYIQAASGGVEGWIYYNSVRYVEPSLHVAPKVRTKGDKFIEYVEAAWYDNPDRLHDYIWGAEGQNADGKGSDPEWDCSGLFHAALTRGAGLSDTRTTAHGYMGKMHAIDKPSQVGDVAFHKDSSGHATHIVIYTDDGYFIEARGKDFGIERHAVSTAARRSLKWYRSDKINAALKAAA